MDTQKRNNEILSNPDFTVPAQEELGQNVEHQPDDLVQPEQVAQEQESVAPQVLDLEQAESLTTEPDLSGKPESQELEKTDETLNDALVHQSAETSSEASFLNDIATGETPVEKLNSIL